jgi:hypothetical protein
MLKVLVTVLGGDVHVSPIDSQGGVPAVHFNESQLLGHVMQLTHDDSLAWYAEDVKSTLVGPYPSRVKAVDSLLQLRGMERATVPDTLAPLF